MNGAHSLGQWLPTISKAMQSPDLRFPIFMGMLVNVKLVLSFTVLLVVVTSCCVTSKWNYEWWNTYNLASKERIGG